MGILLCKFKLVLKWGEVMGRRIIRVLRLGKEKKWSVLIVLVVLVLIMGGFIYFFNSKFLYNGKIVKNVYIEGVNVFDMIKVEVLKVIIDKYILEDLNFVYDGKKYIILLKDIDLKYDIEDVVKDVYESIKKGFYF